MGSWSHRLAHGNIPWDLKSSCPLSDAALTVPSVRVPCFDAVRLFDGEPRDWRASCFLQTPAELCWRGRGTQNSAELFTAVSKIAELLKGLWKCSNKKKNIYIWKFKKLKKTTTNAPLKTMQILWSSVTVSSLVGSFFTSTCNEGCDSHEWHANIYFNKRNILEIF